jgi:PleD family two-component response regulator
MDADEDLDSLLMRADKALYAAKAGGRDRVEVADALAPAVRAVRA